MKFAARVTLGIVVVLAATLVLPRSAASRLVVPDAMAQLTPTIPDILDSPKPSPSPSPSEKPDPGGGGGSGPGGGGGGDDDDKGDDGDGKKDGRGDKKGPGKAGGKKDGSKDDDKGGRKGKRKKKIPIYTGTYRPSGRSWTTDRLTTTAAQLRALGWSHSDVIARVFAPFIIGGEAAWQNTWGAPRYGPGPIVRTHEGQDVFCEFGDPILATEPGVIEFDGGGLGGRVARLFRPDGSYWYYAHLSDWNLHQFSSGDRVQPGDVIGYCGNSGNALTTPPHVHFGWYKTNGNAINPHRTLIEWLHDAEDSAYDLLADVTRKAVKNKDRNITARLFGDDFAPDRSELRIASESLWASGSFPATGALGLAQSALQAALADSATATLPAVSGRPTKRDDSDDTAQPSPSKTLNDLLGSDSTDQESGD